jgi:hypothetical protein
MDGSFVGRQKIIQLNDYVGNLEHPGGIPAAGVIAGADDRVRRRRKRRLASQVFARAHQPPRDAVEVPGNHASVRADGF